MTNTGSEERKIALFIDLENLVLGIKEAEVPGFDIGLVMERLLEKGKIIVKRAYADWDRFKEYKRQFHEAAIEMLEIPRKRITGKNSADIRMVVDTLEMCYAREHIDTFALVTGDSDFSPLVSKLKENDRSVIGIGMKDSSSALLVDNCDEFIYYEDLVRTQHRVPAIPKHVSKKQAEAFTLLIDVVVGLMRENKEVLWGSMVKQTLRRKKPNFDETYYGYDTFSALLLDARDQGLINLERDKRSGSFVITGFGTASSV